jgi:hypothetical protein
MKEGRLLRVSDATALYPRASRCSIKSPSAGHVDAAMLMKQLDAQTASLAHDCASTRVSRGVFLLPFMRSADCFHRES